MSLRNECNQPQGLATLFVHISVTDYIPDAFAGARSLLRYSRPTAAFFRACEMYLLLKNGLLIQNVHSFLADSCLFVKFLFALPHHYAARARNDISFFLFFIEQQ